MTFHACVWIDQRHAKIFRVGATGADKNYSLLFIIAAAFVLLGGLVILRIRSVR